MHACRHADITMRDGGIPWMHEGLDLVGALEEGTFMLRGIEGSDTAAALEEAHLSSEAAGTSLGGSGGPSGSPRMGGLLYGALDGDVLTGALPPGGLRGASQLRGEYEVRRNSPVPPTLRTPLLNAATSTKRCFHGAGERPHVPSGGGCRCIVAASTQSSFRTNSMHWACALAVAVNACVTAQAEALFPAIFVCHQHEAPALRCPLPCPLPSTPSSCTIVCADQQRPRTGNRICRESDTPPATLFRPVQQLSVAPPTGHACAITPARK